jgi:hypothetical protein
MSMNLPGLQASIDAAPHSGQLDQVSVDSKGRSISYQAGANSTKYEATLLASPRAGGASSSAAKQSGLFDHVVSVSTTAGSSGSERLSFEGGRDFSLVHNGPSSKVALTLSDFESHGQPVAVKLPKIGVRHGEDVTVTPLHWGALGSTPIRIRTKIGGRSTSRLVRGRRIGRTFARVRSAKLHAGKGGGVDLKLRLRHPAAGAWISPSVTILRGSHAVAKTVPAQILGRGLRGGTVHLKLNRPLHSGHYTLHVRLLEVTADGPIQGSQVVSKSIRAAAKGR